MRAKTSSDKHRNSQDQPKPVIHEPVPHKHSYRYSRKKNIHQLRNSNGFNKGMTEHRNIYGSQDCDVSTTEEATVDAEQNCACIS